MAVLIALTGVACAAKGATGTATIVVDVPLARAPTLAHEIANGARLAAEQIDAADGVRVGDHRVVIRIVTLDSGLSPEQTTANVQQSARIHAVAVVDEGTGVDAAWRTARAAGIPIGIVHQGGQGLVDPATRPNVFRIAPTDRGIAFRFAEYLVPKHLRVAFITDDSPEGTGGATALREAFSHDPRSVVATITVSAGAPDLSTQVLQARRAGATALLVWAQAPLVAEAIAAARASGWDVPVYAPPSAEDPVVRQQLAAHPGWVDGLTFALARLTSEKGPAPYESFRTAYERRFGYDEVGLRSGGRPVIQAPDWPMYAYDFVHIVAAAMTKAGTAAPSDALVRAMEQVEVLGANGDERAFNERNHEGVVDDDIFFAVFRDMTWTPVKDDLLSSTLPGVTQTR